ncbi:putative PRONE domain-containing protein [Lupinus albus]|uniref:Putative PRONE domain-containing protein n=1 Tax=Lupinus albus TaxID=3870 RepID=A0A6A4NAT7_LUPAL|nr:putative PRONE domain-containing protein [Lupinus albus]
MVRALEQDHDSYRSKLFNFKGMFENTGGRHTKSLSIESATKLENPSEEDVVTSSSKNQGSKPLNNNSDKGSKPRIISKEEFAAKEANDKLLQELEQMKERFAKLLLGEDMSGGGKGVSSALALSNAFTNLAAAIFGESKRLEPMPPERKARWRKEIDWLLSVTDYIVEMVPSQQKSKDGSTMEIMTTRQRRDLHMNIPALRKLDTMLNDCLDNFKGQSEFYYVKKEEGDAETNNKNDEKWWLPTPKVPEDGLSDVARKFLQYQKDCVTQVLKAAMAINAQTLSEMEIPESYIESLPKNGRASLGDLIYRSITDEYFDPDQLLCTMDLSSEHKILDLKNKIEASIVIWRRKMNQKDSKSAWGSAVSMEKRELFEERAETILHLLKHRFPGIPQSALDISKIQFNMDVGQAVLESYSRILESLAYTVLSRIEDVLNADYQTQNPIQLSKRSAMKNSTSKSERPITLREEVVTDKVGLEEMPAGSMTLSDFMGWLGEHGDLEMKKESYIVPNELENEVGVGKTEKVANISSDNKVSYLENLGGVRNSTWSQ